VVDLLVDNSAKHHWSTSDLAVPLLPQATSSSCCYSLSYGPASSASRTSVAMSSLRQSDATSGVEVVLRLLSEICLDSS
jgi:hypothetical protein